MSSVADILSLGKDAERDRIEPVCVDIVVDPKADRELVLAIKGAFLPEQPTSQVHVALLGDVAQQPFMRPDIAVIVGGGSDDAVRATASTYARLDVPTAVVAESALDAPLPPEGDPKLYLISSIAVADHATLLKRLGRWVITASPKSTAMAANFAFCRRAKVSELMSSYASKNAAVGAVGAKGVSNSVAMTTNQAKLALEIAAAYGRPITAERSQELAGVVSAGVGYRKFAHAAGELVPGLGWAFNAGMGYVGTMATAAGVVAHFERQDAGERALPHVRALIGGMTGTLPKVGEAVGRLRSSKQPSNSTALSLRGERGTQ